MSSHAVQPIVTTRRSHRCGCWSPGEPACSAARCGPSRRRRAMSSRCPGARSSTSSTPPRSPTPCATSMASCTWRPGSARSSSSRIRTRGARTIGFARTLRGSSSTRRSRPGRRSTSSPPSRSSTRRTARRPRTRQSARSCRSCAPRSPPSSRLSASPAPADAASSCGWVCSTARAPVSTSRWRLRRHAARLRCRARAPLGAVAAQRHLQRLP